MERSRVCIIVHYNDKKYSCEVEDDKIIKLLFDEYMIYMIDKNYIKDFLKFLNMKRNDNWPTWIIGHNSMKCYAKRAIDAFINQYKIIVYVSYEKDKIIKITNQRNQKFIDFINRRFLLKSICKKYNMPKDIHMYLTNFFFERN